MQLNSPSRNLDPQPLQTKVPHPLNLTLQDLMVTTMRTVLKVWPRDIILTTCILYNDNDVTMLQMTIYHLYCLIMLQNDQL